jgi:uncharacterized metal-binding protein
MPSAPENLVPILLTLSTRRRRPKPYERRALILLAGCGGEGCTEAVMRAHGFTDDQLMKLERLGIVAKTTERVVSGLQTFEVVRLKIREADHQVVGG